MKDKLQEVNVADHGIPEANPNVSLDLIKIAYEFYRRGWLFGTSGNLSALISRSPFVLSITGSGLDKSMLNLRDIVYVDDLGKVLSGDRKPSSETLLHVAAIKQRKCSAVFHTHSIWGTILSKKYLKDGGFQIEGYEMLKGLENVVSHDHAEWIPVLENSQDMRSLSVRVNDLLENDKNLHCFLLSGHGLYVWGNNVETAKRHTEVLEFLLEVHGRLGNSDI